MSKSIHMGIGLVAALTHPQSEMRTFARLSASPAGDALAAWFNAELNRPDCVITELLFVVAKFAIQIHAGFAVQVVDHSRVKAEDLVILFQDLIAEEYPDVWNTFLEHTGGHA